MTHYTLPIFFFIFSPTSQHTLQGCGRDRMAQCILHMLLPLALWWPKVSTQILHHFYPGEVLTQRHGSVFLRPLHVQHRGFLSGTQPALSHPRPARTKSALCCTPSPHRSMAAFHLLFGNKQNNSLIYKPTLSYSKALFVQAVEKPGSVFQQQTKKIMPWDKNVLYPASILRRK